MPKESLLRELSALREQLEQQPPLNEEQRAELELLIRDIELKLANEDALNEGSLVDGVNLAVERFEVSHPTLAGTLRS
ncbi:chromosome partitioning protein ParA, partial [Mycolicibacterium porcinum]